MAYSAEVYRAWGKVGPNDAIVALALASAATLVLTYRFTPRALRDAVRSRGGTFTVGPTTAFIALTHAADVASEDLRTLDRPFSGGAPIPAAVVERYRHKFGHGILGTYGLTEATGPTHMVPIGGSAPVDPGSGALSVGLHDDYRSETVGACVARRPGQAATESELAAFCRERVAAYKVPRVIRFLPELPKTATVPPGFCFLRR